MSDKSKIINKVIESIDYELMTVKPSKDLTRGEYVATGISATPQGIRKVVGYVCQILIGEGAFGTDTVSIRSIEDSVLTPHENQVFFKLTDYQIGLIKGAGFHCSPEGELLENPLGNYGYTDGSIHTGFLVRPREDRGILKEVE